MNETELRSRLGDYTFYHTIKLTEQLSTPGWPTIRGLVGMGIALASWSFPR